MEASEIIGTLRHGKFFGSKKSEAFLWGAAAIGLLSVTSERATAISFAVIYEWSSGMTAGVVCCVLFGVLPAGAALWAIVKNRKVKTKIALCLEDAYPSRRRSNNWDR